jgi:hypothetical protein
VPWPSYWDTHRVDPGRYLQQHSSAQRARRRDRDTKSCDSIVSSKGEADRSLDSSSPRPRSRQAGDGRAASGPRRRPARRRIQHVAPMYSRAGALTRFHPRVVCRQRGALLKWPASWRRPWRRHRAACPAPARSSHWLSPRSAPFAQRSRQAWAERRFPAGPRCSSPCRRARPRPARLACCTSLCGSSAPATSARGPPERAAAGRATRLAPGGAGLFGLLFLASVY